MTLTPVGHCVVPAGSVADVIDLSDSQLDRKALRRDGRDVLESDGRVREQNLKKRALSSERSFSPRRNRCH
jgi:hypothetical protein